MDSGKQGSSSDSSSSEEQSDHRNNQVKGDSDSSFAKRSYGCIFCKRGFTNAQALGGHMNIHRKDRANAKQIPESSSSSSIPSKHIDQSIITNLPNSASISLQRDKYYPSVFEVQMNYQPSASSPSDPHGCFQEISDLFVPRSTKSLSMNQELWGSDLSLQIGPNNELRRREVWNNDGVDLELRLGHDP